MYVEICSMPIFLRCHEIDKEFIWHFCGFYINSAGNWVVVEDIRGTPLGLRAAIFGLFEGRRMSAHKLANSGLRGSGI